MIGIALAGLLIFSACADTSEKTKENETAQKTERVAHTKGVSLVVTDGGQLFDYQISVIGLSAFGIGVTGALDEVNYEKNRALWDKGFADTMAEAGFDDMSLITLAAATSVDSASNQAFLTDAQRAELKKLIDKILASGPSAINTKAELAPALTSGAMLLSMSQDLEFRKKDVTEFVKAAESRLADSEIECTPAAWTSKSNFIVAERAATGLELKCTDEQFKESWEAVISTLEDTEFNRGITSSEIGLFNVAASVSNRYQGQISENDHARVQRLVDEATPNLGEDAYSWLYFYKTFVDNPGAKYTVAETDASAKVLLFFASHGAAPTLKVKS